jgi:hypothetical protein
MTDILTHLDRLQELSELMLAMCKEYDMQKFFELDKKFKDTVAINKLEDEVNNEHTHNP